MCGVFLAALLFSVNARADVKTWTGNSSVNWNDAGNWDGGVVPASGDSLVFGAAGTSGTMLTNNFDGNAFSVSGITFTADAPSYTIAPNWVALTGGIVNNSVNAQTINLGHEIRAAVTINAAAGDINILQNNTINPLTNTLTIDGAKNTTINLAIGGSASTALIKNGAGTLTLNPYNSRSKTYGSTFAGAVIVNNGIVVAKINGALGDNTSAQPITVNEGGTIRFDNNDTLGTNAQAMTNRTLDVKGGTLESNGFITTFGAVTLNGGTILDNGGHTSWKSFNLKGKVTANGSTISYIKDGDKGSNHGVRLAGNIEFDVAENSTLDVSAILINKNYSTGGLNKTGEGTMILSGANEFEGGTTITGGTISVATGSTGLGKGAFNLTTGGTLEITGGDLLDTLTVTGAATLNGKFDLTNYKTGSDWGTTDITLFTANSIDSIAGFDITGLPTTNNWLWEQSVNSIILKYSGTPIGAWNWKAQAGLFMDAANWENGKQPVPSSDVTINNAGGVATVSVDAQVTSVTLGSADNLTFDVGKTLAAQTMTMTDKTKALNLTGGNLILINAPEFNINNSDTTNASTLTLSSGTYGAVISGNTNLIKTGAGELTLSGVQTYTGQTTVSSGTLTLGAENAIAASTSVVNNATINASTAQTLQNLEGTAAATVNTSNNNLTLSNSADTEYKGKLDLGTGTLTKTGTGALTLTAAQPFTGNVEVNGGTLVSKINGALGNINVAHTVTVNENGTIRFDNHDTFGTGEYTPKIAVVINGGTLESKNSLTTLGAVTLNGGTILDNGGANVNYWKAFNLRSKVTVTGDGKTSYIKEGTTGSSHGINLAGVIEFDVAENSVLDVSAILWDLNATGKGGFNKTGAGTMILSGANEFTGGTTVTAGTISVATGISSLGKGDFTLNTGGTLEITGNALFKTLTVTGAATLNGTFDLTNYLTDWGTENITLFTANSITDITGLNITGLPTTNWSWEQGADADANSIFLKYTASPIANWTWTAQAGLFMNAANWESGEAPNTNSAVTINNAGGVATVNENAQVASVTLGSADNLAFSNNATLTAQTMTMTDKSKALNIFGGNLTLTNAPNFNINTGTGTTSTVTLSKGTVTDKFVISGNGNFTKVSADTLFLNAAQTYTGTTTVSGGILSLGITANAIAASGKVQIDSGAQIVGFAAQKINNLNGSGTLTANGITINSTLTDNTFNGTINAGATNITFEGTGSQKMSFVPGGTDGTLTANSLILRTGKLDIRGEIATGLELRGGTFSPGNSVGLLTANSLILEGTATMLFEFDAIPNLTFDNFDKLTIKNDNATTIASGTFDLSFAGDESLWNIEGAEYQLIAGVTNYVNTDFSALLAARYQDTWDLFGRADGVYLVASGTPGPTGVPEPSTWALLILGALGLTYFRRKR